MVNHHQCSNCELRCNYSNDHDYEFILLVPKGTDYKDIMNMLRPLQLKTINQLIKEHDTQTHEQMLFNEFLIKAICLIIDTVDDTIDSYTGEDDCVWTDNVTYIINNGCHSIVDTPQQHEKLFYSFHYKCKLFD